MSELSADYWSQRYQEKNTPWDLGNVSPAIKEYMDRWPNREARILIPGAGRAYEALYLHQQGFTNVYVCDWAPEAFQYLRTQAPDFPEDHQLIGDFFALDLTFDLLIEQTFFAAIAPAQRDAYVRQAATLLKPDGWLVGLLFDGEMNRPGPPFGASRETYRSLFSENFTIHELDTAKHSVPARRGLEVFVRFQHKDALI